MTIINSQPAFATQTQMAFKGKFTEKMARNILFSPETKQYIKQVTNSPTLTAEEKKILLGNQCAGLTIKDMMSNIIANIRAKFGK